MGNVFKRCLASGLHELMVLPVSTTLHQKVTWEQHRSAVPVK